MCTKYVSHGLTATITLQYRVMHRCTIEGRRRQRRRTRVNRPLLRTTTYMYIIYNNDEYGMCYLTTNTCVSVYHEYLRYYYYLFTTERPG